MGESFLEKNSPLNGAPDNGSIQKDAPCNLASRQSATQIQQQETSDECQRVIACLGFEHRVIVCRDGIQWIAQRRKKGGAERPWRSLRYFRSREALIRFCATLYGRIDPAAWAALAALPEMIGG